jgi:hypothetical protein
VGAGIVGIQSDRLFQLKNRVVVPALGIVGCCPSGASIGLPSSSKAGRCMQSAWDWKWGFTRIRTAISGV